VKTNPRNSKKKKVWGAFKIVTTPKDLRDYDAIVKGRVERINKVK